MSLVESDTQPNVRHQALKAELASHIDNDGAPNRKHGSSKKTIKVPSGTFELETPRDRAGSFEPQLIKKQLTV